MLVFGRFTLLAWVYVTYMLARGGFYTSTCTRASHYCGHPLRISLDGVPSTIYACCILHNKALDFKEVHASRSQLKPDVAKKASTWDLITEEFKKTTSLGFPTGKLKTKWKNLISSLKDKNNHSKGTGGGAAKKLNALCRGSLERKTPLWAECLVLFLLRVARPLHHWLYHLTNSKMTSNLVQKTS